MSPSRRSPISVYYIESSTCGQQFYSVSVMILAYDKANSETLIYYEAYFETLYGFNEYVKPLPLSDNSVLYLHFDRDLSHCDRKLPLFASGYMGKQPVSWKEYCAEYWSKEIEEDMEGCTGRRDITDIMLKASIKPYYQSTDLNLLT